MCVLGYITHCNYYLPFFTPPVPNSMVRIQKRISDGMTILQYFTMRDWIFHNTKLMIMQDEMSPEDKKLFPIDFKLLEISEYMKGIILGTRQYCMKENLSSLPRARRHQTM